MKKTLTILAIIFATLTLSAANIVLADGGNNAVTVTQPPIIPAGANTATNGDATAIPTIKLPGVANTDAGNSLFQTVLPNITTLVIGLTGGLSLLFVIIGGIQALTAYGTEDKLEEAKKTVTWALLGLVIAMLSYAIVQIIVSIKIQ